MGYGLRKGRFSAILLGVSKYVGNSPHTTLIRCHEMKSGRPDRTCVPRTRVDIATPGRLAQFIDLRLAMCARFPRISLRGVACKTRDLPDDLVEIPEGAESNVRGRAGSNALHNVFGGNGCGVRLADTERRAADPCTISG